MSEADLPRVFLSYGRSDALELADKLAHDLEHHVLAGHARYRAWKDRVEIKSGVPWTDQIVASLRDVAALVALMSPHSVRTRSPDAYTSDSVCLDEISYARFGVKKPIVPVMAVQCEPPFEIFRLDYVDFTRWKDEPRYHAALEKLLGSIAAALRGETRYRHWVDRLQPWDFSAFLENKRRGFVGREWLFAQIVHEVDTANEPAVLVVGEPRMRSNGCSFGRARSSRCSLSLRISTGSTPRPRRCSTASWRASRRRILLLVNYRPEYQHAWGAKTYYTQLRIDPLPPASADALLSALLGKDRTLEPLKRVLIERTEGNPFFLEESVQTLVETQVLVGDRGAYRMTKPPATWQIPATAQAILAARIDRLPPDDKRLLQTAAVIGKDVAFALLQAIADGPEDTLRLGLTHLQAAEFLYETSLFPELEYTFKHALTHEVTYGSMLQERRKTLHARIVGAIERCYPDRLSEHVERLAHHALRGVMWEKAVTYLHQAGAKAAARSANREAVGRYEQALEALQHLPESRETRGRAIDLRFDLRAALFPLGEFERITGCLREAEGLARALDDQRRLGLLSAYLCQNLGVSRHPTEALAFGQTALAIAESLGDVHLKVTAKLHLGAACTWTGDYRRAEDLLLSVLQLVESDQSRESFRDVGFPAVLARAYLTWGLAERGKFMEGLVYGQEGIRLAEAVDHPFSLVLMCWVLATLQITRGELSHAIGLFERGLALAREWALYLWLTNTGSLGYAYALSGRIAEGIGLLEHALSASETIGYTLAQPLFLGPLGEAYVLAGRLDDALECAGRALTLTRERGQRRYEAWALRLLGEIDARRDPPAHAGGHYRDALALAEELELRPLVAHCHLGLGKLYRRTGKRQEAQEHLTTATTMYREMDMRFWLEQAEAEMKAFAAP